MTESAIQSQQNPWPNLPPPTNSISLIITAAISTAALLILAAFWVPVDITTRGTNLSANLFVELSPRGVVATVLSTLDLGHGYYVLARHLFQALWLFLIVLQFSKSLSSQGTLGKESTVDVLLLSFLFCFNTVVFTTNGFGEFIDVVPYALILCALPIAFPSDSRITIMRWVVVTVLMVLAVMTHEKSIFDIAILIVWAAWKHGPRYSATLFLPSVIGSVWFLGLVSSDSNSAGMTVEDYLESIRSGLAFMYEESFNVWGVLLSAGALWVIFLAAAYRFLKHRTGFSLQSFLVVALITLLCFAPLLVAHDTIRMVGLIWLPTILLICELDLKSLLKSIRFRQTALALCLVQLLLPPILMYRHGVVPYNCYSREIANHLLPQEAEVADVAATPFALYTLDRKDISERIVCWPLRPIRGEHHLWPY